MCHHINKTNTTFQEPSNESISERREQKTLSIADNEKQQSISGRPPSLLMLLVEELQWNKFKTIKPTGKGLQVKKAGAVSTDNVLPKINSCEGKKTALLLLPPG